MRSVRCDKCNALLPLDGGACLDCLRNFARIEKSKIPPRKRAVEQLRTGNFEPSNPRGNKKEKRSKSQKMLAPLVIGAITLGVLGTWFSKQDFSPTPPLPPVVRTITNGHCEKTPKIEEGLYWTGFCIGDLQGSFIAGGNFDLYLDKDAPAALRKVSATQDFYNLVCDSTDFNRQSQYEIEMTTENRRVLTSACKVGVAEGYKKEHQYLVEVNAPAVQSPKPRTRAPKPRSSKPVSGIESPKKICATTKSQNPAYDPSHRMTDDNGHLYSVPQFLYSTTCI